MRFLLIFFLFTTAFGCGKNLELQLSQREGEISDLKKELAKKENSEKLKDEKIKELEKKDNSEEINKLKIKITEHENFEKLKDKKIEELEKKDNSEEINKLKIKITEQENSEKLKDKKIKELEKKDNSEEINKLKIKIAEHENSEKIKDEKIKNLEEKVSKIITEKSSVNDKNKSISNRFNKLYNNNVNDLSEKIKNKLKLATKDELLRELSVYFFNKLNFQIRKIKNKSLALEDKYGDLEKKKLDDFNEVEKKSYITDVIYVNIKKDLKIDLGSINNYIEADMLSVLDLCLQLVIDMDNANPKMEFLIPKIDDEFDSRLHELDNNIYIKSIRRAGIKDEYTVYEQAKVN